MCSPGDDLNLLLLETIFAALCCWLELVLEGGIVVWVHNQC